MAEHHHRPVATGLPKAAPLARQCGSCNACCDILGVAAVDKADTFRFWRATSPEHLQRLHERIAEVERIRQEFGSCVIPENEDDDPKAP